LELLCELVDCELPWTYRANTEPQKDNQRFSLTNAKTITDGPQVFQSIFN